MIGSKLVLQYSNLEKGFEIHVRQAAAGRRTTLVKQMDWLDRNMETLLQQAPAETVRFVTHTKQQKDELVAPPLPAHIVSQTQKSEPSTSSATTPPLDRLPSEVKPNNRVQGKSSSSTPRRTSSYSLYTPELAVRREKELKQLQTRFPDSYRVIR